MADYIYYPAIALTGGGDDALDGYDGGELNDKDVAIVVTATAFYHYILDDDSGAAESSPDVIKPDDNAGTKRWILVGVGGSSAPTAHKDSHDPQDGSDALDTAVPSELAEVQAAAEGSAHSLARSDHTHQIQHGIADNHLVTVDQADAATGEFAKFTANGIESRSKVELLGDINVADGADVSGDNAPQAHKDSHDPEDGGDPLDTAAPSEIAGVQASAVGTSHSLARADHAHQIQHGIADNHLLTVDQADAATGEFAKFTANGIESRSKAELLGDLNVEDGADVTDAVNIASSIVGVADKATPVDADSIALVDSAAASVLKETTWSNIKATLKTYFDTLYNKYVHPNHSGAVTSVADGATEITDKAVTLAKMDDMATASILGRNTAAVGVPEVLSKATALSLLNVEDGADVTDATNVAAATAVMEGDATTAAMGFVVDEDNMVSDLDTKVPTQQSVKKYVDDNKVATVGIVADTTPQLGGDLDLNSKNIDFPTTPNISDCLDEDSMVSDSATKLATQQSIKAYVDSMAGTSSGCYVYRTVGQSIADITNVKVQFNVEGYDNQSEYDNSVNYRFTAKVAGVYAVDSRVSLQNAPANTRAFLMIHKNGAEYFRGTDILAGAVQNYPGNIVSASVKLEVNEYIEIYIWQSSGGALNTTATQAEIYLTVQKVTAATEHGSAHENSSYAKVSDVKATTTAGGDFTSGSWQTRVLNTEDSDPDSILSLSSNQITLAAGTYECRIQCPAFKVDEHQAKLRNITTSTNILLGTNGKSDNLASYGMDSSVITGRFTIAASQVLEVQHRCATTNPTTGFGDDQSLGQSEIYTVAEFWKISETGWANTVGFSSRASAYLSSDQADAATATWTKVELDTEEFDGLSEMDVASTHRFVAASAGYYQVNVGMCILSLGADDLYAIAVYKNGSAEVTSQNYTPIATSPRANISKLLYLAANDYVELYINHGFGAVRSVYGSKSTTFLTIHRVS